MTEPDDRPTSSTGGRPTRSGGGPRRDTPAGAPRSAGGPRSGSARSSSGRPDRSGSGAAVGRGRPGTGGRSDDRGGAPRRDDRSASGRSDRAGAPRRDDRAGSGRPERTGGPRRNDRAGAGRPERAGGARRDDRPTGARTNDRRGTASDRGSRGGGAPRSDDRRGPRPDTRGRGADPRSRGSAPSRPAETERFPETPRLEIPSWARSADLDPSVRSALRSLSARAAEEVSGHLAAAAEYLDDDPAAALAHARVARSHAARVAVVREAVGIAAYRAGEWSEALSELHAAHRMSGEYYLVPLLMDTERALGRPQAALKLGETLKGKRLDAATRIELAVVTAGVRRDLGSPDSALAVLEREDLRRQRDAELNVRLWYAYADALEHVGRREEAATWFGEAAGKDREGTTDAADRAAALL